MLLRNMLQTLSGTINSIWVGRLIGEGALAATANANIVMFLVVRRGVRLRHGDDGQGRPALRRARHRRARGATFGSGVGLLRRCWRSSVALLGWFCRPTLLHAARDPAATPTARRWPICGVIFVSMPFRTVSMMLTMGLRGAGDAKTPLYAHDR